MMSIHHVGYCRWLTLVDEWTVLSDLSKVLTKINDNFNCEPDWWSRPELRRLTLIWQRGYFCTTQAKEGIQDSSLDAGRKPLFSYVLRTLNICSITCAGSREQAHVRSLVIASLLFALCLLLASTADWELLTRSHEHHVRALSPTQVKCALIGKLLLCQQGECVSVVCVRLAFVESGIVPSLSIHAAIPGSLRWWFWRGYWEWRPSCVESVVLCY